MGKIGYVRVSKDTQDVASQIKLMTDLGIDSNDIFVDSGIGGATKPEKRPVFKKMLERINSGDVDEIVFSEFSRIGRTVDDSLMTLIPLKQRGITIRSLSAHEDFINKLPSEMQTWMISGMLFAASMEKKHNNERTKWGIENARASGKQIGRPMVKIDFDKIKSTMETFGLREKQAVRVCGYSESTFYKWKKSSAT
jgi:putative DNA-invertase from lambdoid prophage Rac